MHISALGFLLLASLLPSYAPLVGAVSPLVDLGYALYDGTPLQNGVSQWLGMRFAAPPVGNLRFRTPVDPPTNRTVQAADQHGPLCISLGASIPTPGQSEDCLFLDVYAPTNATTRSLLPVFFYIGGGGFVQDSNSLYNGTGLVLASDLNIIIVTIAYRVGVFGFLASKEVQKDGNTNVGLLDQRKALQWVQQHISKFGGNPNHVVLGGPSAGAISIVHHLLAFNAAPTTLFHAVIAESQALPVQLTIAQSQYQYDNVTRLTGCNNATDTISCLRGLDLATLQKGNVIVPYPNKSPSNIPLFMWFPTIDGTFLTDLPQRLILEGKFIKVPSVFGDDTDEGTIFADPSAASPADLTAFLQNQIPMLTDADGVLFNSLYPKGPQFPGFGEWFSATAKAWGELAFICPGQLISSAIANFSGGKPTWNYHYDVQDPTNAASGLGVFHTAETNAIFEPANTAGSPGNPPIPASYSTPLNAPIIPVIQGYWTSFIRTFDPNALRASGTPVWQDWGRQGEERRLRFVTNATAMESVPSDQRARCAVLGQNGLRWQQ